MSCMTSAANIGHADQDRLSQEAQESPFTFQQAQYFLIANQLH